MVRDALRHAAVIIGNSNENAITFQFPSRVSSIRPNCVWNLSGCAGTSPGTGRRVVMMYRTSLQALLSYSILIYVFNRMLIFNYTYPCLFGIFWCIYAVNSNMISNKIHQAIGYHRKNLILTPLMESRRKNLGEYCLGEAIYPSM